MKDKESVSHVKRVIMASYNMPSTVTEVRCISNDESHKAKMTLNEPIRAKESHRIPLQHEKDNRQEVQRMSHGDATKQARKG